MIYKTIDDTEIVSSVVSILNASNDKRIVPKQSWDKLWQQYMGQIDWGDKEDWQAKIPLPKIWVGVERIAGTVRRALIKGDDWFKVEPRVIRTPDDVMYAQVAQKLLQWWLMKSADLVTNLTDCFKSSLLSSLLCMLIDMAQRKRVVVSPNSANPRLPGNKIINEMMLETKSINPENVYIDASGRGRFLIVEEFIDKSDLQQISGKGQWKNIDAAMADGDSGVGSVEGSAIEGRAETGTRKEARLTYYWGDLWNSSGELIGESVMVILYNRKYVIFGVEDIPYWDAEPPVVVEPFIRVPFSVYHMPFFAPSAPIVTAMQEILNLIIDGGMLSSLPNLVMDTSRIDARQADDGIYPLKIWKAEGGFKTDSPGIAPVNLGGIRPEAIQVLYLLEQGYGEFSSMTEFEAGLPSRRSRSTVGERQLSLQQTEGFTTDLISSVEDRFMVKILQKAWNRIIQFQPDVPGEIAPNIESILGKEHAATWEKIRSNDYSAFGLDYVFKVFGISRYLTNMQRAETIMGVIRIMSRSPEMMYLVQSTMPKLMAELFMCLDIDIGPIQAPTTPLPLRPSYISQQTAEQPPGEEM